MRTQTEMRSLVVKNWTHGCDTPNEDRFDSLHSRFSQWFWNHQNAARLNQFFHAASPYPGESIPRCILARALLLSLSWGRDELGLN